MKSEWSGQIEKLIRKYRLRSIFFQNLRQLFRLLLIPLLIMSVLIYTAYHYIEEKEMKSAYGDALSSLEEDIDSMIRSVQSQITQIAFDTDVELYMNQGTEGAQFELAGIQEILKVPLMTQNYMSSMYLYARHSDYVITEGGMFDYSLFYDKEALEFYYREMRPKGLRYAGTRVPGKSRMQLSVYQEVHYNAVSEGLIVINLDLDKLVKKSERNDGDQVFLINGDRIVYATDESMADKNVSAIQGYENCAEGEIDVGEDYCIARSSTEVDGLKLVTFSKNGDFHQKMMLIRTVLFLVIAGMMILMVIVCVRVSERIFRPIRLILTEIEKNRLSLVGGEQGFQEENELSYIIHSIKQTAYNSQNIEMELADRIRLLKKAQSVALQSQINPHFLNNTLETINWMAMDMLSPENPISEMLEDLSVMFRMALEDTDIIIPISQEIEHASHYVKIQRIRYDERFDLDWQIDEVLYQYKTIKIVLQPLIENAIYHGIKRMEGQGLITVGGRLEDELVHLWVEDNGPGMTEEDLEKLKRNMNSEDIRESRHIGTANVNQRIRLYFGNQYGIIVHNNQGRGCRFELVFPAVK